MGARNETEGQTGPWEIHTESDGNLHWSVFYRNPLRSAQLMNRDTQSFLYEDRQESAQKKSCCFPEARQDTRIPGFVLSLAEST